jgi:hypothetical protein
MALMPADHPLGTRHHAFSSAGLLRPMLVPMADPHVLTGLIAKRAEIAGQIEHTEKLSA